MLIVSKFRDYYDSAMAAGIDKSLVYKRVNEPGKFLYDAPRLMHGDEQRYILGYRDPVHVIILSWVAPLVFCGKLYIRAMVKVTVAHSLVYGHDHDLPLRGEYLHSGDDMEALLKKVRGIYKIDREPTPKYRYKPWVDPNEVSFKEWGESRDWTSDHIEMKCPVFIVRHPTREESLQVKDTRTCVLVLEKNPVLKELGFFQVKTPFEAFQEIAMFMGGVMGIESRPMVQLSDKEVHQKHGFDKWSFRKMSINSK